VYFCHSHYLDIFHIPEETSVNTSDGGDSSERHIRSSCATSAS